jgi:gas vesicle protein
MHDERGELTMYGATQTHDTYADAHGNGFMMGLLWGTAVGAALGLLLAPKSGSELRSELKESAGRLRHRAADVYDQAYSKMDSVVAEGREAVRRGREKFDEVRRQASEGTGTSGSTGMPTASGPERIG